MGSALQNVLRPGSHEFVIVLNVVLALLFFVMLAVIYTELEDSFHVFVLLFLVVAEGDKPKQEPSARAKTD
ncbi:hypothetical protein F444_16704 [Phytophthora nicotianae P1976]|uniref:Uncharacterized protein n=1 Tax=Phytophthora nicotianae P1976 TaxID=1317066 RepID=A0A080ZHD3_PHYNI|nr:hypothetical protein F444_16704 [Phytophthora nicotianae P1976]